MMRCLPHPVDAVHTGILNVVMHLLSPSLSCFAVLGTVPYFEHQEVHDAAPRASMTESCAVPLYITEYVSEPRLSIRQGKLSVAPSLTGSTTRTPR